jgi:hypothetical protein
MKANELRIGNLIFYPTVDLNTGENVLEIIEATANDIKTQEFKPIFLPIPLTEEWLLKFGIKKDSGNYFSGGGVFELYFVGGVLSFELDGKVCAKAESVHQLQNVYFYLMGEELTIKE